jgi:hypothetical protein
MKCVFMALAFALPALAMAQSKAATDADKTSAGEAPAMETVALSIDGISSTSGEDNPGILYILPWQPPTLPRRSRAALETNAAELLEPMDPVVFDRHQNFQQSMNPVVDSSNSLR